MNRPKLNEILNRFLSLKTNKIYTLPIVILMPHSSCNCRCVMCDIWKSNSSVQQLKESDISGLLNSLSKLRTKCVVMSGGEALLHPNFFKLCDILNSNNISITVLSTGLLLKKYAKDIINKTNEVIVSIDGSESVHNKIRNIPNAFNKLKEGISEIKALNRNYRITGRCVIQKDNFKDLQNIIVSAKEIGLDQISFLTADVTTEAFNRPNLWSDDKIADIKLSLEELPIFKKIIDKILKENFKDFKNGFIAESQNKFRNFYSYYAYFCEKSDLPKVSCNAPWVSTVIEPDGSVRPCFFHKIIGNIKNQELVDILNSETAINFRKKLDIKSNPICKKCVCNLNFSLISKV